VLAQAVDPDNPEFQPPTRDSSGNLLPSGGVASVRISADNLPAGAKFDPATQLLTWTPGYADAGTYTITFNAIDDGDGTLNQLTAAGTLTINVLNADRAPQLAIVGNQSVERGATLDLPVTASDPDGDPLAFKVTGLPRFATFTDYS